MEALRLAAIAGIAVFHTFQPWFAAAVSGAWAPGASALWALGSINLLGAFGNHVFFAISGRFLISSAARASREEGYWCGQARKTARRLGTILASVTLWAVVALAVSALIVPVPGVGLDSFSWLTVGLEFIWVYAALMVATPLIGWLWARMRHPGALAALIAAVILAVSAYIAFVSPGGSERGLFEWRKLMSAASYLASFLMGGVVAGMKDGHRASGARWPFACALVASLAIEGVVAATGNLWLLSALSFKSTSLLSFVLAITALMAVTGTSPSASDGGCGRLASAVRWIAPATLGYYIAQSMFGGLWRPAAEVWCRHTLALAGFLGLLLTGVALSLILLVLVLIADRLMRLPLLRLLRLR